MSMIISQDRYPFISIYDKEILFKQNGQMPKLASIKRNFTLNNDSISFKLKHFQILKLS